MKKKILVVLIVIVSFLIVTGCEKGKESGNGNKKVVSNIELGKKQYIEQLKKVTIDNTDDYLIITEKRKWEEPEAEEGTTISFEIAIPYTIHVDGKDYSSEYYLGDYQEQKIDKNPKYNLKITNLTSNYETEVLIEKK